MSLAHISPDSLDRETLLSYLHAGIVGVTFDKLDGTERVMRATLNQAFMPVPAVAGVRSFEARENDKITDRVNVWSVDDAGWRSFRFASIKEIRVDL